MQGRSIQQRTDATITARGHQVAIRVAHGHLIVDDGFGESRRSRTFHRTDGLNRLVILARDGYISLSATRWLADTGAGFVQLDLSAGARLIATSAGARTSFPALRRTQARAVDDAAGVEVARGLLGLKVSGQRQLLDRLPVDVLQASGSDPRPVLDRQIEIIERAEVIDELLAAEAIAASAYWQAWAPLPIRFPAREASRLPAHWLTFGARASRLTGGPRRATGAGAAILNFLYVLASSEAILAAHQVGLDPDLGIFHRDQENRASLALDMVEAIRPLIDSYALAMLTQRTLSAHDFVETRAGECRVTPRLAEALTGTCELWREAIAPVAEQVANTLARHAASPVPVRSPLTRAQQRATLDGRMPDRRPRVAPARASLPNACRQCGALLTNGRARYCQECQRGRWAAQAARSRRTVADLGNELQDALAEQLYSALRASSDGLTRTQLQRLLNRNVPGDRIQAALSQLADSGRARSERVPAARGRPAQRWTVTGS